VLLGALAWPAHARVPATASAAENSPLGLARNFAPLAPRAERSQDAETPLENGLAYGQNASDTAYATRGGAEASNVLLRTAGQLQAKFKHAAQFGVKGNYSKANAAEFSRAIHQHINSPGVRAIQGTYHKNPVTHYLDPQTGLNVIADPAGNFISGWKLSPGQLQNVLTHGGL
jgi:hypothetical protein